MNESVNPISFASQGAGKPEEKRVSAEEYCNLLISRAKLERFDAGHLQLSGLHDRETGERFLVETSKLGVYR